MTPSEHFDNLAIVCIRKASELEALADLDTKPENREKLREMAAKERREAISYLESARTLAAHL
jgi:hypothetical protein